MHCLKGAESAEETIRKLNFLSLVPLLPLLHGPAVHAERVGRGDEEEKTKKGEGTSPA